jgi:simple sugar transport system permease protein
LAFWVPLLLCAAGLLVTFTAGLWNIGVEGQMIMGALGASWVALKVAAPNPWMPGWLVLLVEILVAMAAGALWAALAGILKTRGGVHEIFGGVALNNLAIIATNFLISGPWQPPEGGTFRGTEPFPSRALFPLLGDTRFSPLSLLLALVVLLLIALSLRGTTWGLRLKALGKNPRSAFLLGVASERETLTAMLVCGAAAGLAGSVRVLSWFDSLRQSISGGIGFLAILIVLLAGMRPLWTLVIALLFSGLLTGGTIVQLRTQLKAAISGIIQGTLVLFVLLFGDYRLLRRQRKDKTVEGTEP